MGDFVKTSCGDRDKEISERDYRNRFDMLYLESKVKINSTGIYPQHSLLILNLTTSLFP